MPSFHATVRGSIEPNRFISATVADSDPETIEVEQTPANGEPDFYTRRRYADGDDIYISVSPDTLVWLLEANGNIERGQYVANGSGGKLVGVGNDDLHSLGIALESGAKGDLVQILHQPQVNASLANELIKQSGGSGYTSEMARDDVATMLTAGSNVQLSRDDAGNTLTVSATDTQFSGQWADITGKPSSYPPDTHGNGAHSTNYAAQSALFSGQWADISGKPNNYPPAQHGDSAHGPNYAKQSDLHSKYTDANAVSAINNATISPAGLNMPAQSSTPSNPSAGDIYVDDGTNTSSGSRGFRQYDGSAWVDL